MRSAGRGTLLLTGSVAAEKPSVSAATVGVAKAALRNLGLSLHSELAPDGIQAVTVTIRGVLHGAKALDVDEIADRYWALHIAAARVVGAGGVVPARRDAGGQSTEAGGASALTWRGDRLVDVVLGLRPVDRDQPLALGVVVEQRQVFSR